MQTSEFTHHDFIVKGDLAVVTEYYMSVLGLRAENEPVIDGDWQKGPGQVFLMEPGESHWYLGFVSPNNICGKLKFIAARDPEHVRDRSRHQRVGEPGITLHSLYTPVLEYVRELAVEHGLQPSPIMRNEFSERSFLFTGPDGVTWQILDQPHIENLLQAGSAAAGARLLADGLSPNLWTDTDLGRVFTQTDERGEVIRLRAWIQGSAGDCNQVTMTGLISFCPASTIHAH